MHTYVGQIFHFLYRKHKDDDDDGRKSTKHKKSKRSKKDKDDDMERGSASPHESK